MIRKYTSLKKLALATLALGALAQPAAAFIHGDFKVYPGSLCVAQGVQPNSSISIGPEGTVFNISTTSDLSVVCPIVRDNVSQNGHPTSVVVSDRDVNPDPGVLGGIRCSLHSRDNKGQLFATSTGHSDVTGGDGGGFVINSVPYHDNFGGFQWGYIQMQCVIPRAVIDSAGIKRSSGIRAYEVRENLLEETVTQPGLVEEEL